MSSPDYSPDFYRQHAQRYSQVAHEFLQSVYVKSSHKGLRNDWDAWERLKQLAPGKDGLDAGCGSGARDVFHAWSEGYHVIGIDAIEQNIQVARDLHPEIANRVMVADLGQALDFENESFDFVLCNAVIQHIEPALVRSVVIPEFARVLRPGGVLQLMFKNGRGLTTVFDKDYGVERTFQLYEESDILKLLEHEDMTLVSADSAHDLGGLLYFTDVKGVDHCMFYARKAGAIGSK